MKELEILCENCGERAGVVVYAASGATVNGVRGRIDAFKVRMGGLLRQFFVTCRHCEQEFEFNVPKPE